MAFETLETLTPLMKQYWDLKQQAQDALLLFRMGDFYELFGQDAIEASRILEITLTSRDKNKENPTPMAGVPHHSVQGYIQKLLKAGKKVAIGEQLGEVSEKLGPKSIVRREIVRTFTPAVQFDQEGNEAAYLGIAIPLADSSPGKWVLCFLDPSTGETLTSDPLTPTEIQNELLLESTSLKHLLKLGELFPENQTTPPSVLIENLPFNYLSMSQALDILRKNYGIDGFTSFINTAEGILGLGILITYVARSQKLDRITHLKLPAPLHQPRSLILGPRTAQHLDLLELFELIRKTKSCLGTRQLRRWLMEPLCSVPEIEKRQAAVKELSQSGDCVRRISQELSELYDLERICARINTGLANPRDSLALGKSLALVPKILDALRPSKSELLNETQEKLTLLLTALTPISEKILSSQLEEPPISTKEGGIFKRGVSPELDHLLTLTEEGQEFLVKLEVRERAATGIPSLKVRYNRVFGYYIEITQAHLKNVPPHYQRKQTTVGGERFFTEELKKFEEEIITASARLKSLEHGMFDNLIKEIQVKIPEFMQAASLLGIQDALVSLACLAQEPGWIFPQIDETLDLEIQAGRHPLVDTSSGRTGQFVPNDLSLSPETRLTLLITGPNMGGKSTVMRQAALIVLLGQMGAPVPARKARWGVVSALYTRIGAQDAISKGQSTFMVEMSELAHILHRADSRALIILDEIGRGTSTYDGVSVAWATLEWICTQIRARTLFATHYHELTKLVSQLPSLANAHMAVDGGKATGTQTLSCEMRFLYLLREGPTNESFGIHVAKLAGLPLPVVERAWKVLEILEKNTSQGPQDFAQDSDQLSFFGNLGLDARAPATPLVTPPPPHPVITELMSTDFNSMTPVQALNLLVRLKDNV